MNKKSNYLCKPWIKILTLNKKNADIVSSPPPEKNFLFFYLFFPFSALILELKLDSFERRIPYALELESIRVGVSKSTLPRRGSLWDEGLDTTDVFIYCLFYANVDLLNHMEIGYGR